MLAFALFVCRGATMADESVVDLPPGFRFHPTDEEIVTHYLSPKIVDQSFSASAMGEVDLNRCEPWDLPSKAKMGEKEWYFFCRRDRKYPTGMRTNRATGAGFWKATGKDKEVFRGRGVLVGMKKTLVFYRGRAPKGEKTNWVMHEYRLEGTSMSIPDLPKSAKDEWVVCRVFHKDTGHSKTPLPSSESINSLSDDFLDAPHFNSAASFSSMNHQAVFYTQVVAPGSSSYSLSGSYSRALGAERNDDSSAIRRHCKVEQHSDKSMGCPWQGTGLSADHNTEISSVVSKPYDDLDDPPSTAPFFDLEDMWSF